MVPNGGINCDEVKKVICGKVIGCKRKDADLKKLKDLSITIGKA